MNQWKRKQEMTLPERNGLRSISCHRWRLIIRQLLKWQERGGRFSIFRNMKILAFKLIWLFCFLQILFFQTKLDAQTLTANPNPFPKRTLLTHVLNNDDTVSVTITNGLGQ